MSTDTIRVKFSLGIGLIHRREAVEELDKEEYTNPDGTLNEDAVAEYMQEWANNYIDMGYTVLDDGEDH